MKKACIAIGVDKVIGAPNLAPLRAAGDGAERFAAWATTQQFECFCLTDRADSLDISAVKSRVRAIVNSGSYGQLLIYFAGHGILKSWDTEIWLLSHAASDPNEAVNLAGSASLARNSGIPHVVFVSDACRSIPTDTGLAQVSGSIIFPIQPVTAQRPEIDVFYATLPGDPAYEAAPAQATAGYQGVFTTCLLKGLAGPDPSVCEVLSEANHQVYVVSSRTLKPWLEREVPESLAVVSIALNQAPDLRVESQWPKYLVRLSSMPPKAVPGRGGSPPSLEPPAATLRGLAEDHGIGSYFAPPVEPAAEYRSLPPKRTRSVRETKTARDFNEEMDRLLANRGRESFETHTGFTVVGSGVRSATLDGLSGLCDVFEESGATQIRVRLQDRSGSVVLEFFDGNGTCLAALSGYIGTITVEDGRVVNVSYAPARNTQQWISYQAQEAEVDKRRAFAAVAARRGIFRVEKEQAESFADYVRELKLFDPTLGIYAAYAYAQGGMVKEVKSVFDWMQSDLQLPVPFDVAMLANKLTADDGSASPTAGRTPMLTQGWSLLHEGQPIASWVIEASRYTLPSLWTLLSPEGVAFVTRGLASQEV